MSSMLCVVSGWMPGEVAGPAMVRRHRAGCLRCQAEAVRMRGLLRDLASLRAEVLAAPPGLHAAVMERLGDQGLGAPAVSVRARVAAGAGAAVVAVAAIAGGLVLRRQRVAG